MTRRFTDIPALVPAAAPVPAKAGLAALTAAIVLMACAPQSIDTMTPSEVGRPSQAGAEPDRYILTQVDLSQMDASDMVGQMRAEMDALVALFDEAESQADVEGRLKQVELAGINYRTMILRVSQALDAEDADTQAAWSDNRARLRRAHRDLMATGRRLSARYPEISTRIDERFDKFDFGLLAARTGDQRNPRLDRGEQMPR